MIIFALPLHRTDGIAINRKLLKNSFSSPYWSYPIQKKFGFFTGIHGRHQLSSVLCHGNSGFNSNSKISNDYFLINPDRFVCTVSSFVSGTKSSNFLVRAAFYVQYHFCSYTLLIDNSVSRFTKHYDISRTFCGRQYSGLSVSLPGSAAWCDISNDILHYAFLDIQRRLQETVVLWWQLTDYM